MWTHQHTHTQTQNTHTHTNTPPLHRDTHHGHHWEKDTDIYPPINITNTKAHITCVKHHLLKSYIEMVTKANAMKQIELTAATNYSVRQECPANLAHLVKR